MIRKVVENERRETLFLVVRELHSKVGLSLWFGLEQRLCYETTLKVKSGETPTTRRRLLPNPCIT